MVMLDSTRRRGSQIDDNVLAQRLKLQGETGPKALFRNFRVFLVACFACIGGLLYGYNQGVFSGLLTMTNFNDHMGSWISDPSKKGWLTSILELGAWFGTMYSGFLAEIISRKYAIMVNTGIFIIGVIIQCTAASSSSGYSNILGGRFITGMGVGSLSMIVPMYVAETAPPEVRGLLIAVQQFAIEFGILISFWIDYGTNFIGGTGVNQSRAAWLVPLCLQLAPAIVLIVGMAFMPFSPRWLVHHGREAEARRTIATLRDLPSDHELVEIEFLEIKAQSLFEKRTVEANFPSLAYPSAWNTIKLQFVAIGSLFTTMPMFRRVIVATVTMFFQQWTGINAILYYAPNIFGYLGLSSNTTSLLATGVVGIVMFIATIPAMLYIDKVGRKPVLAIGALAMGFCHFTVGIIFAKNQTAWLDHRNTGAGWGAIFMVWLFVFHFGWSWGPCAWILVAEVWPMSARPYGIALGASSNWMNNFIVGQVTPDMLAKMKFGTFFFFGALITLGAAFIWFFVPETKQLSLEEMDLIFGSSGIAQADKERMAAINAEVGLDRALAAAGGMSEKVGTESHLAGEQQKVLNNATAH